MDHSSALPLVKEYMKNATVIASLRGKDAIIQHYGDHFKIETVKTGDQLNLGKRTLQFVEAPMLHWPDSMFTYVLPDKILMPNDAFGQHLATSQRFDDEVDEHVLMEEAAKYYANILMLFGSLITRKIEEVGQLGVAPVMIAPSHGVIWRSNPAKIVNAYLDWSVYKSKWKIVIVYDTMWGSTAKMAKAIADGAISQGVDEDSEAASRRHHGHRNGDFGFKSRHSRFADVEQPDVPHVKLVPHLHHGLKAEGQGLEFLRVVRLGRRRCKRDG